MLCVNNNLNVNNNIKCHYDGSLMLAAPMQSSMAFPLVYLQPPPLLRTTSSVYYLYEEQTNLLRVQLQSDNYY